MTTVERQTGEQKTARNPVKIIPIVPLKKPDWIRVKAPASQRFHEIKQALREHKLHTVCEEASCPNIGECFGKGTATFMILGDLCTRRCPFCDVAHGRPLAPDAEEPVHLAQTIAAMRLKYVVITSVDRMICAMAALSISPIAFGQCASYRRKPASKCWCPIFAAGWRSRWRNWRQVRRT
jgi:lipoic acid synthetase